MSLNIFFRHQAQIEYATATTWYEDARSGLGDEFEAAVEVVLRRVPRFCPPTTWQRQEFVEPGSAGANAWAQESL